MITKPVSLPPTQDNAFAWHGPDMINNEDKWLTFLTPGEIRELENAAEILVSSGKDVTVMTVKDFPLPTLGPKVFVSKVRPRAS